MSKSKVRIEIGSPRPLKTNEDKNRQIFEKNVRVKIADFGKFQLRDSSVLSGVLVSPFRHWHACLLNGASEVYRLCNGMHGESCCSWCIGPC